jgi:hypothetical protein
MVYGLRCRVYDLQSTVYRHGNAKKMHIAKNCLRVFLRTMCWRKYHVVFKQRDIS